MKYKDNTWYKVINPDYNGEKPSYAKYSGEKRSNDYFYFSEYIAIDRFGKYIYEKYNGSWLIDLEYSKIDISEILEYLPKNYKDKVLIYNPYLI